MTHPGLQRLHEPLAGREVFRGWTSAGLEVLVAPMPGFVRTSAVLAARFGSLDRTLPGGLPLPAGTAHFLEHEMFLKEDGDVFAEYDARGAAGNAYTTWTSTAYVFTCSEDWPTNLETLLGAVRRLEVGEEDVRRERRIIAQEIAMFDDDPSWRGYLALLEALYHRHPVREDVAGSEASIEQIDAALLGAVHAGFYHPANLVLAVAGRVDPARVLATAEARLDGGRRRGRPRRRVFPEPAGVRRRSVSRTLPVARPSVWLGLKDDVPGGGRALIDRQVLTGLVLGCLFDDGGRIQARLYDEGLIDDTFHATYESEADVAHAVLSAEVDDVKRYQRVLWGSFRAAAAAGLTQEEVERARRRMWGQRLGMLNAPEAFAQWLAATALERLPLDAAATVLERATLRRLNARLRRLASCPRAWAVMQPVQAGS